MNSTHIVEIVPLKLTKHFNADTLSVCELEGFFCVTGTDQWNGKEIAAYIPPDNIVDTKRPEFAFLALDKSTKADGTYRVKAKKIRGVVSFGLLVPAPEGSKIGDDVTEKLGVTHYDPIVHSNNPKSEKLYENGEQGKNPTNYVPQYDLESRKYAQKVFIKDEPIIVTEKIHGENSRYVFENEQMFCGSHYTWKKEFPSHDHVTIESIMASKGAQQKGLTIEQAQVIVDKLHNSPIKKNKWWYLLEKYPQIRKFCEENPEVVLYGESMGGVGGFPYGVKSGDLAFAAFDIYKNGRYLDAPEFFKTCWKYNIPTVPLFNKVIDGEIQPIPFDFESICEMAEGKTTVNNANHIKEGVVICPWKERNDQKVGRLKLKFVGVGYFEKG